MERLDQHLQVEDVISDIEMSPGQSPGLLVLMPQHRVKRFGWARAAKRDSYAMYLAARDPRVPWDAKVLAFLVVAYVLSPIDLMPGPVDDLVVVVLGTLAVAQLVPMDIMAEHRAAAARVLGERPQVEDEDDG